MSKINLQRYKFTDRWMTDKLVLIKQNDKDDNFIHKYKPTIRNGKIIVDGKENFRTLLHSGSTRLMKYDNAHGISGH